jgi:hypothetical protein
MKPAFGRKSTAKLSAPESIVQSGQQAVEHNKRALDDSTDSKFLSSDANVVDKAYEIIEPILADKVTADQARELCVDEYWYIYYF